MDPYFLEYSRLQNSHCTRDREMSTQKLDGIWRRFMETDGTLHVVEDGFSWKTFDYRSHIYNLAQTFSR